MDSYSIFRCQKDGSDKLWTIGSDGSFWGATSKVLSRPRSSWQTKRANHSPDDITKKIRQKLSKGYVYCGEVTDLTDTEVLNDVVYDSSVTQSFTSFERVSTSSSSRSDETERNNAMSSSFSSACDSMNIEPDPFF
ncbi:hypothetical protein [uncultured Umboniibacter sp.]|uniref:hypothetical protein n=1 Tax=uncultured Umboniibacter sp. TaxID=1798917 RepID=UPI002605B20D|nr:hypothetical protein [uncultured Umboniibacter sp.]